MVRNFMRIVDFKLKKKNQLIMQVTGNNIAVIKILNVYYLCDNKRGHCLHGEKGKGRIILLKDNNLYKNNDA